MCISNWSIKTEDFWNSWRPILTERMPFISKPESASLTFPAISWSWTSLSLGQCKPVTRLLSRAKIAVDYVRTQKFYLLKFYQKHSKLVFSLNTATFLVCSRRVWFQLCILVCFHRFVTSVEPSTYADQQLILKMF